jgi:hypothetical protein
LGSSLRRRASTTRMADVEVRAIPLQHPWKRMGEDKGVRPFDGRPFPNFSLREFQWYSRRRRQGLRTEGEDMGRLLRSGIGCAVVVALTCGTAGAIQVFTLDKDGSRARTPSP